MSVRTSAGPPIRLFHTPRPQPGRHRRQPDQLRAAGQDRGGVGPGQHVDHGVGRVDVDGDSRRGWWSPRSGRRWCGPGRRSRGWRAGTVSVSNSFRSRRPSRPESVREDLPVEFERSEAFAHAEEALTGLGGAGVRRFPRLRLRCTEHKPGSASTRWSPCASRGVMTPARAGSAVAHGGGGCTALALPPAPRTSSATTSTVTLRRGAARRRGPARLRIVVDMASTSDGLQVQARPESRGTRRGRSGGHPAARESHEHRGPCSSPAGAVNRRSPRAVRARAGKTPGV